MTRLDQRGSINALLVPLIVAILLLVGAGSFAVWAYGSRQDYKNHSDQKAAAAATAASQKTSADDAAQFAETAKKPLKPYKGPEAYGSIVINYPKTWSAYVVEVNSGGTPVDGYFQPDVVPSSQNLTFPFALRLQVVATAYDQVLKQFAPLVQQQKIKVTPYSPALVKGVNGVRVDGQIVTNKQGSMVVLPFRDKTLKLWTESNDFEADFNNNILPNYTFSP